jgi:cytochrome c553
MKRALSSLFVAGSLVLAGVIPGLTQAQDAPQKPDVKAGEQLFVHGDTSRGVLACMTCHGAAGNSTIPANPNLAGMPHEYIAKQLRDFQAHDKTPPVRTGANGAPTIMSSIAANLKPQDIQNLALYLS